MQDTQGCREQAPKLKFFANETLEKRTVRWRSVLFICTVNLQQLDAPAGASTLHITYMQLKRYSATYLHIYDQTGTFISEGKGGGNPNKRIPAGTVFIFHPGDGAVHSYLSCAANVYTAEYSARKVVLSGEIVYRVRCPQSCRGYQGKPGQGEVGGRRDGRGGQGRSYRLARR